MMDVFKCDIISEQERWIEGNAEGHISDIQCGSASEGAHTVMHKSISVDISPPLRSRVVKIPVVIAAV